MDIEKELIQTVVLKKEALKLMKSGIKKDDFIHYPNEATFIFEYARLGNLDKTLFRKEFPRFQLEEDGVYEFEYIRDKFVESLLTRKAREVIKVPGTNIEDYIGKVIYGLSSLQQRMNSNILVYDEWGDRTLTHDEKMCGESYQMNIPIIDTTLGGCYKGQNFAVIAPMKTGKTWFMAKLATEFRRQGARVIVVTKEIKAGRFRERIDAIELDVDFNKLRKGMFTDSEKDRWLREFERKQELDTGRLYIIEDEGKDIHGMTAHIRELRPDIMLVDGAYLWSESMSWEKVTEVTRTIASWSRKFNILVGYSWQTNTPETKSINVGQVAFAKNALLADVDFALGINVNEEFRKRKLMEVKLMNSRDSDTVHGYIGWEFNEKSYPEISTINDAFHLEDMSNTDMFEEI